MIIWPQGIMFIEIITVLHPTRETGFAGTIIKSMQNRMVDTGDVTHIARYLNVFQGRLIDIPRIGQLFTTDSPVTGKQ